MKIAALVLVVDDVRSYRTGLVRALRRECGIESLEAEDIIHAIRMIERHPELRAVAADYKLPRGGYGDWLLETVGRRWPQMGRILLSAWTDTSLRLEARRQGYEVLDKREPWPVITSAICALAA